MTVQTNVKQNTIQYGTRLVCAFQEVGSATQQMREKIFMGEGHAQEALNFFAHLREVTKDFFITHHEFSPVQQTVNPQ